MINILELKIKEHSDKLFRQRYIDLNSFWTRATYIKKENILELSRLIDGVIDIAQYPNNRIFNEFNKDMNLYYAHIIRGDEDTKELKEVLVQQHGQRFTNVESIFYNNKVAFFLSYVGNTGAVKMLLLHKRWLEEMGFQVDLFVPYPTKGLTLSSELFGESLTLHTYTADKDLRKISSKYDIAFAPHWDHIYPLHLYFKKVFFFSQGDYDVFSTEDRTINILKMAYLLPIHIFTVSNFLKETIETKLSRSPAVIPCGIDVDLFTPQGKYNKTTITVIGNHSVPQKRIVETLSILKSIKNAYDIDIIWVNPQAVPTSLSGIKVVNNPPREELAEILSKSHLYVSGSEIESFSLPPLEAMASGTPVISVNNGGITQYGDHMENLILVKPGNWDELERQVLSILSNKPLQDKLIRNGLETSNKFQIDAIKLDFQGYINRCLTTQFKL